MKKGVLFVVLAALLLFLATAPTASAGWDYYREIEIDHSKVSGGADLNSFPVLINLSADWLEYKNESGYVRELHGYDIVFTNATNDNLLDYEIEKYNGTAKTLVAWVGIPALSPSTNTTIRLYYGNPDAADWSNATGVWDTNFKMVQHLNESCASSGCIKDSTSNDIDGTPYSGGTITNLYTSSGKIDGADDFDGSDDHVVSSNLGFSVKGKTLSAWVKLNDVSQGGGGVVTLERYDGFYFDSIVYNEVGRGWGFGSNFWHRTAWSDVKETSTDVWVHLAATYTDYDYRLYRNGVQILHTTSYTAFQFPTNSRILVGKRHTGGGNPYLDASIDEVRISNIVRGNYWINTSYTNQKDPSAFYSVGGAEGAGDDPPVPELPTIILLAVGLVVLAGYVMMRRRRGDE